jgi:hypothetical protein
MMAGMFNRNHLEKMDKMGEKEIREKLKYLDKFDVKELWDFVSDEYVGCSIDFKYPKLRDVVFSILREGGGRSV